MIVGSGLLARAFNPYFGAVPELCVYAAGVSNSTCYDEREFARERNRLKAAMAQYESAELFLYFGTCSANGSLGRASPYVQHKIQMEQIVSAHRHHLILRLPQLAGQTQNPHTLLNYLFSRVSRSERFPIWKNARRNIIDVDDVARIGASLILGEGARGECMDVANFSDTAMPDVVEMMAKVVGKNTICDYLDCGDVHPIDTQRIRAVVERCGIVFGTDYLERVIKKYYGKAESG